ncbi:MAG: hypothetical protein R3228_15870 [Halioglobus sp.]|nr:hypothetical protein [Halioglobus sp.]
MNTSTPAGNGKGSADKPENLPGEIRALREQVQDLSARVTSLELATEQVDRGSQMLLSHQYRKLAANGVTLSFDEVGFRNYSQYEEDGIPHYIFSLIGTGPMRSVEICAGTG